MHKIKEQKGITLIALVITIIVMLILVGVTISVSLNGGLFTTAKEATDETQIAKEREELLMAALGTLNQNGEVDLSKLDSSLPEGFTGSNGQYTSETGNVFTVTEDGTITVVGESSGEEEEEPVTPPATPTITINPETITGEIESGTTGEEVGTITATVTNVAGDLTWSITPTDSGLELVDTANANVKKVTASKAVENATITVSYGSASDTCSVTVTEKEPREEYKLSGTWIFNDDPALENVGFTSVEPENLIAINFISNEVEYKGMFYGMFSSVSYNIAYSTDLDSMEAVYVETYDGYSDQPMPGEDFSYKLWVNEAHKTLNFGEAPQTVSQEFYEWFTANATKQN